MIDLITAIFFKVDLISIRDLLLISFALIAAFTAIGIPLSMQAVEKAAEKYKSEHLLNYFSSTGALSPGRLIWVSIFYLVLGGFAVYLLPSERMDNANAQDYQYLLSWSFIAYYILFFLAIGHWYSHLLSRLKKRPEEIFDDLKKQPRNRVWRSMMRVFDGGEKALNAKRESIGNLQARIEVVREGLLINPSSQSLEDRLVPLYRGVSEFIYDSERKHCFTLEERELALLLTYCNSLVEINKHARGHNRSLYFASQRWLFRIVSDLYSHPEYTKLFERLFLSDKSKQILVLSDLLYDLAERQNVDPALSGDLAAEGEWVKGIGDVVLFGSHTRTINPDGLRAMLRLWGGVCIQAARSRPERLQRLFNNLRDAATQNYIGDIQRPYFWPEPEWFAEWLELFNGLEPSIEAIPEYEGAYNALHGKKAEGQWATITRKAEGTELNLIGSEWIDIENLQRACIQHSAFDSFGIFFGVIGNFKLWHQLYECWYASQPADAAASYCDHGFFQRKPHDFIKWMCRHIKEDELGDRHALRPNAYLACSVILAEFIRINKATPFNFPVATPLEAESSIKVVAGLLRQVDLIVSTELEQDFRWYPGQARRLADQLIDRLTDILHELDDTRIRLLKACMPDPLNIPADRKALNQAWAETNSEFWSAFKRPKWNALTFVRSLPKECEPIMFRFHPFESYYLSEKSGKKMGGLNFNGATAAVYLMGRIWAKLITCAQGTTGMKSSGSHWFISNKHSGAVTHRAFNKRYGFSSNEDFITKGDLDASIVVEPNAIELRVYEWPQMPWSSASDDPVVVYGFTDFGEKTTGVVSLYFELIVKDPAGITVLN